jgi:hypothetical protein
MFFSCTSCIYLIFAAPIFVQEQFFFNLFFAAHIFVRVLFIYFYCTCLIIVYHQLFVYVASFLPRKKKESNAAIIIYLECTLYLYKYYLLLYFTIETRWKIITVFSVREKK